MKIYHNLSEYHGSERLSLTLGMFDGVHLGHRKILKKVTDFGAQAQIKTGLLTFWPHPRIFLHQDDHLKLLNTFEEKLKLFEKSGIDFVFIQAFDEEFRNLTGEEFIRQILIEKLHTKHLVIGYDHHFGKNKSGDFSLLKQLEKELNYSCEQAGPVHRDNQTVSSSEIRHLLENGNIEEANALLGYAYPVSGKVVHGKQIGRTIGFPTANVETETYKLLPKDGAYVVEVLVEKQTFMGMLSIGTNPTVNGTRRTVEVYILDFNEDIYGQGITLRLRKFLHEQIKFEALERLKQQLQADEDATRGYFKS